MLFTTFLMFGAGFAAANPTKRPDISALLKSEDESENSIDVEELPTKKATAPPVSLGSQLAVGALFPERAGLETGHRIPLHLFPIETQNKILEVEQVKEVKEVKEVTTKNPEKYVDSSSFRRFQPPTLISPPSLPVAHDVSLRGLFSLGQESDKNYDSTLRIFAPPSFF